LGSLGDVIWQKRSEKMSQLTLTTEGETHVIVSRRFAAPSEAVYRAHTDPKLIVRLEGSSSARGSAPMGPR